jgi:gamma-butyrobetaine dioxygenase
VKLTVTHHDGRATVLVHDEHGERALPALWLRERSAHADQIDPVSQQRLANPHRWSPDLAIVEATELDDAVRIRFSDGHEETFTASHIAHTLDLPDGLPEVIAWKADAGRPHAHDWSAVRDEPKAFRDALADFLAFGTIVVTGAGSEPDTVLVVGERFGNVRDTNWGRVFDVRSVPKANDLAYTTFALGPHTDNPYRDPTPGIQLLHCLVNETTGGASTLVDAVAVTDQLRGEDPEGLELLATVPVQYRFLDPTDDLRYVRTVVQRDHTGRVTGLAYSPRMDYMPVMSDASTRIYQRARRRLAELLVHPDFEVRFLLNPGEVMIFDNARVLHGRSAFDPQEGRRLLQGCYLDGDAPRSRYRMLERTGAM